MGGPQAPGACKPGALTGPACRPPPAAQLRTLRFREWAAGESGEVVAAQLVSVLLTEHLSATGA